MEYECILFENELASKQTMKSPKECVCVCVCVCMRVCVHVFVSSFVRVRACVQHCDAVVPSVWQKLQYWQS